MLICVCISSLMETCSTLMDSKDVTHSHHNRGSEAPDGALLPTILLRYAAPLRFPAPCKKRLNAVISSKD